MASETSSPSSPKPISFIHRTHAPHVEINPAEKIRMLSDFFPYLRCVQCDSGELPEELLLCNKCNKRFHMKCVRPIVVITPRGSWLCPECSGNKKKRVKKFSQEKLMDFFGIHPDSIVFSERSSSSQDAKKRKRRPRPMVHKKKSRRLLPFVPTEDPDERLKQMTSLASALTALNMHFSDFLTYFPGMAPRSANISDLENGGMQNLSKEDAETIEHCKAMTRSGKFPPLVVVYDSCQGYTVEADGPIKDMTFIAEYTGDVDYLKNRETDDCDTMMTLLLTADASNNLVICADKRGNIARFISGINNHTQEGRKKLNCKCVRYNVNGECRVFLVATRDISKGERLYYDYNGCEYEYPTHHFV